MNLEDLVIQSIFQIPGSIKTFVKTIEPIHFDDPLKRDLYALILGGEGEGSGYYDPETGAVSKLLWQGLDTSGRKYVSNLLSLPKTLDSDVKRLSNMMVDKYRVNELKRIVAMAEKRASDGVSAGEILRESIGFLELLLIDKDDTVFTNQQQASLSFTKKLIDLNDGIIGTLKTPFESLDYLLNGGVSFGDLVVIASRTNEGKSMLAGQWVIALAKQEIPVAILGLEMDDAEYFTREIAHVARSLGRRDLTLANLSNPVRWGIGDDLEDMVRVVSQFDIHYLKNKMVTLDEVKTYCNYAVKNLKCKAIVIDHSLLITSKDDQHKMVNELTNFLQTFAATNDVLCLLVNQVNRSDRPGKQINVSDMSGGRSIEHAASLLLTIDRLPENKDDNDPYGSTIDTSNYRILNIIKSRNSVRDKHILTTFEGINATFREVLPDNWDKIKNIKDVNEMNMEFIYSV